MKIYFDGGCQPNPGRIEIAVVAGGVAYEKDLGRGSNNDAEWLAALHALKIAAALGLVDVQLLGDSALIVNQANGVAKCRSPELAAHQQTFEALRSTFTRVRIRRIKRTQNLAGIFLAKRRSGK